MLCNFYFTKGNGFFESSSIETVKFRQVRNKIIDLKNNKTSLYKTETLYQEIIKMKNAADRNRTGTGITTHRILSPGRLPVPPLRHRSKITAYGTYRARTYDPLLVRQMLSQLS